MTAQLHEWCAQTGHALTWKEVPVAPPPAEIQWEAHLYYGEICLVKAGGRSKKQARAHASQQFLTNPQLPLSSPPSITPRPSIDGQFKALTVTNDPIIASVWCREQKASYFGFDCEFYQEHLAIIQLATETSGLIYAVSGGISEGLRELLENVEVIKYTVDPTQDELRLQADAKVQLKGVVDVRQLVPTTYVKTMGMDKLCSIFLHLPPKDSLALSNWSEWPLSSRQIKYALTDAIRSPQLGLYFKA